MNYVRFTYIISITILHGIFFIHVIFIFTFFTSLLRLIKEFSVIFHDLSLLLVRSFYKKTIFNKESEELKRIRFKMVSITLT